jgi:dTDP-4-dehydrorhamnose reductase
MEHSAAAWWNTRRSTLFQRSFHHRVAVEDEASIDTAIETVRPDVVINAIGIIKQLPDSKNVITH